MTDVLPLIEADELQAVDDAARCRIVDCRFDLMQPAKGQEDYLEGHIPGAVYADLDRDLAGPVTPDSGRHPLPDAASFIATLRGFGIDRDTLVVVYDQGGGALAARLWWMLHWIGHRRARVLNGGLPAWLAAGGELEQGCNRYPSGSIAGTDQPDMVATTAEVSEAAGVDESFLLLDARDRPRFDGLTEPIDPVAGHVPGAVNFPFSELLASDGRFRPQSELRDAWQRLLGDRTGHDAVVMCGSGVTACHLALSAAVAGIGDPRVYIGSWSEWIRDPSRPLG